MAFTISNIEKVQADPIPRSMDLNANDWKSLIDESMRKDEISMANEIIREHQKKSDYKNLLDMQNRYLNQLKNNQSRLK